MTKPAITLLTVLLAITVPVFVSAENSAINANDFESRLKSAKDPFRSQIDIIKEKKMEEERLQEEERSQEEKRKAMEMEQKKQEAQRAAQSAASKAQLSMPIITRPAEPEPVVPIRATLPNLIIAGIVWNTNRPQAIINGTVVEINDTIAGIKIISIEKSMIKGQIDGLNVTINHKGAVYDE